LEVVEFSVVEVMMEILVEEVEEAVFEILPFLVAGFHSFEFFPQYLLLLMLMKKKDGGVLAFHIQDKGNHMSLPENKLMTLYDGYILLTLMGLKLDGISVNQI
jgi:hypothetical protein